MSIVFTMVLSGNSLFLLFLIVNRIKKDFFSLKEKYPLLKLSLLLTLVPVAYIKDKISYLYDVHLRSRFPDTFTIDGDLPLIVLVDEIPRRNTAYVRNETVFFVWLGVALAIGCFYVYRYVKIRKFILSSTQKMEAGEAYQILERIREQLKIRRRIRLNVTEVQISPFTIGIFSPVVVAPVFKDSRQMELVLLHELYHIKRLDILFIMLRFVFLGLYWFNPLAHMLSVWMDDICELTCDEAVTGHLNREERPEYGMMIIDMASMETVSSQFHVALFSDNKSKLKERIDYIMKGDGRKNKAAVFLALGLAVCSGIPVYAYEGTQMIRADEETAEFLLREGTNRTVRFLEEGEEELVDYIVYDKQFVDEDGNIYNLENPVAYGECTNHVFKSGKIQEHERNSDGNCTVKNYSAEICAVCSCAKKGTRISENEYNPCRH